MLSDTMERRASPENPSTSLSNPAEWLKTALGVRETASGVSVNEETGLEWTAISAGVRLLSGLIASLPFKVFRKLRPGREVADGHPVFRLIHEQANPEQTAFEFWEMQVANIPGWGASYAEKVTSGAGELRELWPIHPDRIQPRRRPDDTLFYRVRLPTSTKKRDGRTHADLEADAVMRIPGFATRGLVGHSLYKLHSDAIGLGIATERFAARFFERGAAPSGVLETDEKLSDQAYERLSGDASIIYEGLENQHRIALLEEGLKWKQVTTDPEKTQLLEGRKFQVNEAARILNVPPHLLGDLERATFSNIEEQNRSFLTYSLNPWLRRIQNRVKIELLDEEEREDLFVEHVLEELLRPNAKGRAELYQTRFQTGSITPNRILEIENENPVDGGDTPFVPVNMIPLPQALEMSPEERAMLLSAGSGQEPDGSDALEVRAEEEVLGDEETEPGAVEARVRLIDDLMPVFVEEFGRLVRGETQDVERMVREHLEAGGFQQFMRELNDYYGQGGRLPEFARERMRTPFLTLAKAVSREAGEAAGEVPLEEAVERFVQKYGDKFVDRYAASSRKQLMALANDAREDGEADPATEVRGRLNEWQEGTDSGRPRAEQWADREAHQLDNAVSQFAFAAAGVIALRWMAIGDSCPLCQRLDGQVVGIEAKFVRAGQQVDGTDGESSITPSNDIGHPPLHSGCWTPDHDIFTAEGWKSITEVKTGDRLWTMDMETHEMKLDRVQGAWSRRHEGEVAHMETRTIDLRLTPDHKMAVVTGWRHRHGDDKSLERREIQDVAYGDAIPRVPQWSGPNPEAIKVAGREWPAKRAMEFVGWYLAEGTISPHHSPGLYQAGIRQHDDGARGRIDDLCRELFDRVWTGQDTIYLPLREDDPMVEWMERLGPSGERFIPPELLKYGAETLRPMFDALIAGDGSVCESEWGTDDPAKQGNFRPQITFSTSSERLADGMTELAMKVGFRPTVGPRSEEPITTTHANGTHTAKKVQQAVSFGRNRWSKFKPDQVDYEPYRGAVIGLSMENNPVVFVRRGRKACWVGNCDCKVVPGSLT